MSFELFFNISKDGNFWTYAGESGTTLIFITWRYYAGWLTSPSIVFYENTSNITVVHKGVGTFKAV